MRIRSSVNSAANPFYKVLLRVLRKRRPPKSLNQKRWRRVGSLFTCSSTVQSSMTIAFGFSCEGKGIRVLFLRMDERHSRGVKWAVVSQVVQRRRQRCIEKARGERETTPFLRSLHLSQRTDKRRRHGQRRTTGRSLQVAMSQHTAGDHGTYSHSRTPNQVGGWLATPSYRTNQTTRVAV